MPLSLSCTHLFFDMGNKPFVTNKVVEKLMMASSDMQRNKVEKKVKNLDMELKFLKLNLEDDLLMNKLVMPRHEIDNTSGEEYTNELIIF